MNARTNYYQGAVHNPRMLFDMGYRQGNYFNPQLFTGGLAGLGAVAPIVSDMFGGYNNWITGGAILADTLDRGVVNMQRGFDPKYVGVNTASNLAGNIGGAMLARQLTGTQDDPSGIVDTVGMAVGSGLTNALVDGIVSKEYGSIPMEMSKAPLTSFVPRWLLDNTAKVEAVIDADNGMTIDDVVNMQRAGAKAGLQDRMNKTTNSWDNADEIVEEVLRRARQSVGR